VNVRSIDTERRTVTVIASTDSLDSYGTIINQSGWDFSRFAKNPVIQLSHRWDDLPIGRATRFQVVNNALELDIEFAPEEANPAAEQVWQLWKLGFIRAVSVGFQPIEYHWEERDGGSVMVYDKAELIEVSVVAIPSNPETLSKSLVRSLRSKDKDKREAGESMLALMARMASSPDDGEEEEDAEIDDEKEAEDLEEEKNRAILKAYRKLVPSLRAKFGVETIEDEEMQIKAIRDAIQSREEQPEPKPETETDAKPSVEEPAKDDTKEPPAKPAEEPEVKDGEDPPASDDELELDENDIVAIADATAEKLKSAK